MSITRGKIAAIAVIAVAVVVLCIVLLMPGAQATEEKIKIVSGDENFLPVYISIKNSDGVYEVQRNKDGAPFIPQLEGSAINGGLADSLFYDMQAMESVGTVNESKDDLEKYNLNEPRATLLLRDEKGISLTLYLGSKSPLDDGYYLTTDRQEDGVYLIDSYYAQAMMRPLGEYSDLQLLDFVYESDFERLKSVGIYGKNRLPLEFLYTDDGFMMTKPVEHMGMQDDLKVMLLTPLMHLRAKERLEADVWEEAGLEDPEYTVELDYDGKNIEILIGSEMGKNRHLAFKGGKEIFLIDSAALDFLKMDYRKLLGEYVYFRSIGEVESIKIDSSQENYDVKIKQIDRNTYEAAIGDKKVNGSAAVALYNKIIEMPLLKKLDQKISESEEYSITIELKNGKKDILRLMKLNEREYAVEINGRAEFSTPATAVNMIGEKLDSLVKE